MSTGHTGKGSRGRGWGEARTKSSASGGARARDLAVPSRSLSPPQADTASVHGRRGGDAGLHPGPRSPRLGCWAQSFRQGSPFFLGWRTPLWLRHCRAEQHPRAPETCSPPAQVCLLELPANLSSWWQPYPHTIAHPSPTAFSMLPKRHLPFICQTHPAPPLQAALPLGSLEPLLGASEPSYLPPMGWKAPHQPCPTSQIAAPTLPQVGAHIES